MSTMVMRTPPQRGILKPEWPGSAQPGPGVWDSHPLRAGDWNLASREQGLKWPQTSAGEGSESVCQRCKGSQSREGRARLGGGQNGRQLRLQPCSLHGHRLLCDLDKSLYVSGSLFLHLAN